MKEITLKDGHILAPFFKNTYDSCPEAFLQHIMGRGFCDSIENPTYGIIQIGDFCYLGGDGTGPQKKNILYILNNLLKNPDIILVPLSETWNQQLYNNTGYQKNIRYALDRPDLHSFNTTKLSAYISHAAYDPDYTDEHSSKEFLMKAIDENYYHSVQEQDWSRDFTANYPDYFSFKHNGFGFVIIESVTGKVVAGASSFSSSLDNIEIVIATNPAYQNKGFATAVSARMVLECIKQDKYPSWDATNLTSVSVAEKLGYHFQEEYVCYIPI